jgi:signal transduction histidine kinase
MMRVLVMAGRVPAGAAPHIGCGSDLDPALASDAKRLAAGYLRAMKARLFRHRDVVIAAAIGVLYVVEVLSEPEFAGKRQASIALALIFAFQFAARRRAALGILVTGLVIILLGNGPIRPLPEAGAFLLGFIWALYSAGRYETGARWLASVAVSAAAIPFAAIEPGQPFHLDDLVFFVVFWAGPLATGRFVQHRRAREHTQTAAAVADERVRIARELHDVVAHAISVIVLQARGARRMLDVDPAETRTALDTIERTSEQALTEMRRLLGVLRSADEDVALAPQPSLRHLDALAAEIRASGLPVDIDVEGEQRDLPPGVDVSAYRIVQEALTNALKHAGPARASVRVRYGADALELEVADDGAGTGNGGGSGYGLAGVRERVTVYGGDIEAGAGPRGGYTLRARLPLS